MGFIRQLIQFKFYKMKEPILLEVINSIRVTIESIENSSYLRARPKMVTLKEELQDTVSTMIIKVKNDAF